ncbi:CDP-glycerol glycerophosphotransferase family protein [Francisella uliginis]|uniref:CDP-glycerol--glycerophosphate glycerophosphotransferase n=1 Tax=Francisella uliginis TaxID=573570 RepID=A0A1L4BT97_9GAMM|nr:CDP-glycerol glycerophosphotransferase family protein [Francisella uliginis]API87071.1 hypothetical protein F7310_06765 [Francisella uliginis]
MSNLVKKTIKKILIVQIKYFLGIVSIFIPQKKNLFIFSMRNDRYADNQKALFEYISKEETNIEAVWLYDRLKPNIDNKRIEPKLKFVKKYSLYGFYMISRASLIVMSHSFGDYGYYYFIVRQKKVLMLWHAVTTKSCGLLDKKFDSDRKNRYINRETKYYSGIIASSKIDTYYTCAYTGCSIDNVYITGLPRHDRIETSYNNRKTVTRVLYAPTFRDYDILGESLFFPFKDFLLDRFIKFAKSNDLIFILRPHPSDKSSIDHLKELVSLYPQVFEDGSSDEFDDNIVLINESDAVITDYSSIYIDFLVANKPCAFIPFDFDMYMEKRGMAYDYECISPGPLINSYKDFEGACLSIIQRSPEWEEKRNHVKQMFLSYDDKLACSRVVEIANKIVMDN